MSHVGRSRRTRVYDCNYNKGESYYRPMLDRLDGKLPSPREPERDCLRTDVESRTHRVLDDFVQSQEELFDVRGGRVSRTHHLSSAHDEDDLSEDLTDSVKRLRAGKKTSRFAEDIDIGNSVASIENRLKMSNKILGCVGVGHGEVPGVRRALQENEERTEKRISRRLQNGGSALTKLTAFNSDEESAAAQRAKASKARLSDLEDEMSELNERSAAREKRAARLRALVADNDTVDSTLDATKFTVRTEREQKHVTF